MTSVQFDAKATIEAILAQGSLPQSTPALDWSRGMGHNLMGGAGAQIKGFVNLISVGGTTPSVTCAIETSPDGKSWVTGVSGLSALTAGGTLSEANFVAPGSKPYKFVRLTITAIGNANNTGEIQWGFH